MLTFGTDLQNCWAVYNLLVYIDCWEQKETAELCKIQTCTLIVGNNKKQSITMQYVYPQTNLSLISQYVYLKTNDLRLSQHGSIWMFETFKITAVDVLHL